MTSTSKIVACFGLLALVGAASAAGTEKREFLILVNGKEVGNSTMTVVESNDGKTYMKGTVSVKIPGILIPFAYEAEVQEWWQADRLTNLTSVSTENSRKTETAAKAEVDRILVSVNGKVRSISWEAWTGSYWKLADRRFHNKDVPILEPDTGKDYVGKLDFVGLVPIKVGSQMEDCFHFKLTGIPVPTELWYDRHHRLVRQEFTEKGQRTIIQLMSRKH